MIASTVVFFCFAIAQPVLGLLGVNPEFFLAHSFFGIDVVVVGLLVSVVLPLCLGAAVYVLARIASGAGRVAHLLGLVIFGTVLWVQVLERLGVGVTALLVVGGMALSIATVSLYIRSGWAQWAVRILSVAAPLAIVAGLSLWSPASALVLPTSSEDPDSFVVANNPVPIVMIVLDEFPIASVIDGSGSMQADLYPNLGRLAADSIWFRNAVTVESNTERAIPSIVSGMPASPGRLPISSDYPRTLFTLLDETYDIWAVEPLTDLCPESACTGGERGSSWRQLLSDVMIVSLHIVLPEGWTGDLPPIDETWADFNRQQLSGNAANQEEDFSLRERFDAELEDGRPQQFEQFLGDLEAASTSSRPTLNFLHLVFPHSPWEYLPDGRLHGAPVPPAGRVGRGWGPNEWLVNQVYQQHLLQVQFTDRLIGRALDRLQQLRMYDNSLVVLMADHGVVFRPNVERRRGVTRDSIGEIVAVPLLIKFPGGEGQGVDDYRAELTDVVPTIADVLDVDLTWEPSGVSLLAEERPVRTESSVNSGVLEFGVAGQEKLEVARRKLKIFHGGDPFELAVDGYEDLLWARTSTLVIDGPTSVKATLEDAGRYETVELGAPTLPAHLSGSLSPSGASPDVVAIGLNGEVVATTRTYVEDGVTRFQAMLPPDRILRSNNIEVFAIDGSGTDLMVRSVPLNR